MTEARAAYDLLQKRTQTEVCLEGHRLTLASTGEAPGAVALRCPTCEEFVLETLPLRAPSTLVRWKRGEPLSSIDRMQLERQLHKMINRSEEPDPRWAGWLAELEGEQMTQPSREVTISGTQPRQLVTQADANRFLNLSDIRTKLSPEMRQFVLDFICVSGLNPALREFTFYENSLYVMADGYRKVLNGSGKFDGMPEPPKYLTNAEKEAQGYPAHKIVVRVALQRKGQRFPVYAVGVADPTAPFRNNPVEKQFPQIMAETRAYRRAARMGFQDVLTERGLDYAEGDEAENEDVPLTTVRVLDSTAREVPADVNPATGEYRSAQMVAVELEMTPAEYQQAAEMTDDQVALADAEIITTPQTQQPPAASPAQLREIEKRRASAAGWTAARLQTYIFDSYGATLETLTVEMASELVLYLKRQAQREAVV